MKNKLFFLLPLLIPSLGVLYNCNNNNVTITVLNEDENKGTVSDTKIVTAKNSYVKVNATPKENYLFTGWYKIENEFEEGVYFNNTYFFEAKEDIKLKAKWENFSSKNFVFDVVNEKYKISHYFGEESQIIVPITHHGRDVITIGKKTFYGTECSSILINDGITSIGDIAFENCTAEYVTLPTTLTDLGTHPFKNWTSEQHIKIHKASINYVSEKPDSTKWGWPITFNEELQKYYVKSFSTCSNNDVEIRIID